MAQAMQRLLQLPGPRGAGGADPEAASPVLDPNGGPPPWYQALQPEELRRLQPPEEEVPSEVALDEASLEPGQGSSQPLRY